MDVLILWMLGMWAVQLLIVWLIYRIQGRRMTLVQHILPCAALLGGAIVVMISIDIGDWNGIGYALLGISLGTAGMLTLITVVIADVILRRRGRN